MRAMLASILLVLAAVGGAVAEDIAIDWRITDYDDIMAKVERMCGCSFYAAQATLGIAWRGLSGYYHQSLILNTDLDTELVVWLDSTLGRNTPVPVVRRFFAVEICWLLWSCNGGYPARLRLMDTTEASFVCIELHVLAYFTVTNKLAK